MGASLEDIASGLVTMQQDENPGRCNIYDLGGIKVLIDFAHNPAAMSALFDMASAIPAQRRVLCFGQAELQDTDRRANIVQERPRCRDQRAVDGCGARDARDRGR